MQATRVPCRSASSLRQAEVQVTILVAVGKEAAVRFWAEGRRQITEFPEDSYTTDAITEHATENIRRFAAGGKPFFVNVSYAAAHSPLHAKPEDIANYRGTYAIGWDTLRERRWRRQIELGVVDPRWRLPPSEPEFLPWNDEPLKQWNQNLMAVCAAMVDSMDQGIGRILNTLADLGIEEQTVVMVLSDNGGCAEQAGGDDPTNVAARTAWAERTGAIHQLGRKYRLKPKKPR